MSRMALECQGSVGSGPRLALPGEVFDAGAAMRPPLSPTGSVPFPRGVSLLNNSLLNKGTAYTERERDALGLRGLLPPRIFTIDEQVTRAVGNFRRKSNDLERYIFLTTLQARNEILFYRVLLTHLEEMMPVIYTPTVGQACLEFGSIFRRPRGLWISIRDRGRIREVLRHWPMEDVRLVVATDGERILGLGDLGALGMGIPIGKLALYTACAGVHPSYCLPVTLDVGTDNEHVLADPMYIGLRQRRVRGAEYDAFLEEFVGGVQEVFPGCLLQFEDFGNRSAFALLERYQERVCTFNDDIQGTASVALGGLMAALRITGQPLAAQRLLFHGAGEAGLGIAGLLVRALVRSGVPESEARRACWFMDSKGLIVQSRVESLSLQKRPYAHAGGDLHDLTAAVRQLRPTALIGVAGAGRAFTPEVLGAMAAVNQRPIVFALSNPTSKSECTAEEAYAGTAGRAVFASGSPFGPVSVGGRTLVPGQGNNVYVFPGVGLGVLASRAGRVTDDMFLAAAEILAEMTLPEELAVGRVYPSLRRIREVSVRIATAVARMAWDAGVAIEPRPDDVPGWIRRCVFEPEYVDYA